SGVRKTGWVTIKNQKYYFSPSNGKMVTGKKKIGNATYYFGSNGARKTGWVTIKNKKYYFSPKMVTGKKKIGNATYYFNSNGTRKTGWVTIKNKKYYFSPKMVTGSKKIKNDTYYFNSKGILQTNCIVGTQKSGYFYVDEKGCKVTDTEVMQAVAFVKAHTEDSWSNEVKLQKCFDYMWKNSTYQRFYGTPSTASEMSGYANYVFSTMRGNCFRYAASFAYVAKVLGYDARAAIGEVSSLLGGMTPHGWTEVKINGQWYICDVNMKRNHPNVSTYMRTEATYPYRHNCNVRYTLTFQNGHAVWN
ncbi:MAG: hypothetical protein NC311_15980, partial [Muribaculaceae bacterium]|nr:hypothetical protein [Muribaculaceae bacterium]MCM1398869.1 hypothetical protein [Clostridium sp.]MCM1458500.1 hypothetical protein [Bacteroides sp.]